MSSGRSARLPPTPNAPNNKQWVPNSAATTTTGTSSVTNLHEPNSNSLMYQYNNTASVPTNMSHHHHQQQHHLMANTGMSDNTADIIHTTDAGTEGIPGETIDALGPELAVATSKVLESLSENERKMIIEVLNRDENVRQRDATRIM
ncbi:hypothetical protein CVS40_9007 [Lucilia cuprina]|nr:hypothetical protein CVS40_9007 [Lucilia cuprina]